MMRIIILAGLLAVNPAMAAADPLQVENPWIREGPPAAQMLAGYGRFYNASPQACVLTGASSESFENIEIHRTSIDKDMVRMARQTRVVIGPGKSVVFEPNGYHFMLMGPKRPLRSGDLVSLSLQFENGATQELAMKVRPAAETSE